MHAQFKIPLKISKEMTLNITHEDTHFIDMLQNTSLIVWDEATMGHKFQLEAIDRSLRDLLGTPDKLFGGITFGGRGTYNRRGIYSEVILCPRKLISKLKA